MNTNLFSSLMDTRISAYLLNKYLKGECTLQEEECIIEWYNSFNDNNDWVSEISETEKQVIKNRIYNIITENSQDMYPSALTPNRNRSRLILYSISSVAAILVLCCGLYLLNKSPHPSTKPIIADIITITNQTKSIYEQTFSDGSHAWLSPGARITFNKTFTGNTRDVTMAGELFFEITKNPRKPFIVHSLNLITKVWGTSFRVRDSKKSSFADVAVVTGKVSVKLIDPGIKPNSTNEVMIYPNQQAAYLQNNSDLKTEHKTEIKELAIWKKVNLSFDNTSLKQVIAVLNKNFKVRISSGDENLKAYSLNADFNGLNLPEIMEILHKTLNVSYEMDGDNIILKRS